MSGYRSLHRQSIDNPNNDLEKIPIWSVATSPPLTRKKQTITINNNNNNNNNSEDWRLWVGCGDGTIRGYLVKEKSLDDGSNSSLLDASACQLIQTHTLLLRNNHKQRNKHHQIMVSDIGWGISQVQTIRNYVGEDTTAGDLLLVALNLIGQIQVYVLKENMDDNENNDAPKSGVGDTVPPITELNPNHNFTIPNATGTAMQILPPRLTGVGNVLVAVPCLDGSIVIVTTGVVTPSTHQPQHQSNAEVAAGTVVDTWSKFSGGSSSSHSHHQLTINIAMSLTMHPHKYMIAVGRKDGLVELLGKKLQKEDIGTKSSTIHHRLMHHEAPVRAISFTPDGHLLATASDDGLLCLWDVSQPSGTVPILVNHTTQAHNHTWIYHMIALPDSQRFVSSGADQNIHVWQIDQILQGPTHTFTTTTTAIMENNNSNNSIISSTTTSSVWALDAYCPHHPRLWTGNADSSSSNIHSTKLPFLRLVSGNDQGELQIYSLQP